MTTDDRRVLLARYPEGLPRAEDFEVAVDERPEPGPGQALLRIHWISVDPAMRTWSAPNPPRGNAIPLGSVMRAHGVGEVVTSTAPGLAVGELVVGPFGLRTWHVTDGSDIRRRLPADITPRSLGLGILGHIGLTAYAGLHRVAQARPGETVLVSSAAGAVGAVAGQLAAIHGCRVIGIAGGPEKVALCEAEYSYDRCIDRFAATDLAAAIAAAAPEGVDVFFDNVGGPTLDAALTVMNDFGRVAICGTISVSSANPGSGPRAERRILDRRLTLRGFLQSDYEPESAQMLADLRRWYHEGRIRLREDIVVGLAEAPRALEEQLAGRNLGKVLIQVPAPTTEGTPP